uniref:type II and III secretion system protein family protein n=1 Tax=Ramlibacter sp. TaxID=1917967 RepID=UPI0025EDBDA9|nr:type II and III secretion system protein family protein [Ramlibacter sp.]
MLGKSRIVRLPFAAARLVIGGQPSGFAGRAAVPVPTGTPGPQQAPAPGRQEWDGVADTDVTLLSPTELYFLGKRPGTMNVILQSADGRCLVKDLVVTIDPESVQSKLTELMPEESGVRVRAADNAIVLSGVVSDAVKLDQVVSLASAYGDGKKVVNLLRVSNPQQVMLEVKIAEVSKTMLDKFGLDFSRMVASGSGASVISGIIGGGAGLLGRYRTEVMTGIGGGIASSVGAGGSSGNAYIGGIDGTQVRNADGTFSNRYSISPGTISKNSTLLGIDAQKKDGVLRVLAEPNIMAISGQTASFLSGGKIFIPVAQSRDGVAGSTITLEEKEFGVGLKFTPTVLDGNRINLKLVSEASELQQAGSPFTSFNGVTAVLPSMATRRVDTTVQLNDGQSFVVAGLIKNNMNTALDKFPGLGEVPVMGALFRSTEFQTDQTELMFVVTPRLVKPLTEAVVLPTDNHVVPSRADVLFMGKGEGRAPAKP